MKIYLSLTYADLREYRASVDLQLRSMGHDVIGMEQYVAESSTPLDKCLEDVRSADLYMIIVGWSYGFIPENPDLNPLKRSITELELETAETADIPVLAFLLDPEAPWPPNSLDVFKVQGGENILRLRARVGGNYLAGIFRSPDSLASRAAAAVSRQGIRQQMMQRVLKQATLAGRLDEFARGDSMADTATHEIRKIIVEAGPTRALLIKLGSQSPANPGLGETWWSTRLYLLALLAQTLTGVRQLVFSHSDGTFAGMASPTTVREGLVGAFPELAAFDFDVRNGRGSQDTLRELSRCMELWTQHMQHVEGQVKVGVRSQLLSQWFGERLVSRCIRLGADDGVTIVHIQQLVDSLIPDIPVEQRTHNKGGAEADKDKQETHYQIKLMVVDRDAFALELAREWVRTEMPRIPVR